MRKLWILGIALLPVLSIILVACGSSGPTQVSACLITKTDNNPFFVKMKQGAQAEAAMFGIKLTTAAGRIDGDVASQIAAIESCIASGVNGILITPSDDTVIPAIEQARNAGILVISLDTPLNPATAADATFATDNLEAGKLIGRWAAGTLGAANTASAKIALLDLNVANVSVDWQRDQGFLEGFGIDTGPNSMLNGDETDPRIVGNGVTQGNEAGGRTALESLLQIDPNINVVYTINEPSAAGAYQALTAAGKDTVGKGGTVLIVSVDGGCAGVQDVADGVIGATSMQFPLDMASLGIRAINEFATNKTLPVNSPGLDFFNTGVQLITDNPVAGVPSKTTAEGLTLCWG